MHLTCMLWPITAPSAVRAMDWPKAFFTSPYPLPPVALLLYRCLPSTSCNPPFLVSILYHQCPFFLINAYFLPSVCVFLYRCLPLLYMPLLYHYPPLFICAYPLPPVPLLFFALVTFRGFIHFTKLFLVKSLRVGTPISHNALLVACMTHQQGR